MLQVCWVCFGRNWCKQLRFVHLHFRTRNWYSWRQEAVRSGPSCHHLSLLLLFLTSALERVERGFLPLQPGLHPLWEGAVWFCSCCPQCLCYYLRWSTELEWRARGRAVLFHHVRSLTSCTDWAGVNTPRSATWVYTKSGLSIEVKVGLS